MGADLAIVECTLESREPGTVTTHLDAREAAHLAHLLGARQTLITHIPPHEDRGERMAIVSALAPELHITMATTGRQLVLQP